MSKRLKTRLPLLICVFASASFCLLVSTSRSAASGGGARPVQPPPVKMQKKVQSRWKNLYKRVTRMMSNRRSAREGEYVDADDRARLGYVAAKGKALKSNIVKEKSKSFDQHAANLNINPQPAAQTTAPPQIQPTPAGATLLSVKPPVTGPVKSFLPTGETGGKLVVQPSS